MQSLDKAAELFLTIHLRHAAGDCCACLVELWCGFWAVAVFGLVANGVVGGMDLDGVG